MAGRKQGGAKGPLIGYEKPDAALQEAALYHRYSCPFCRDSTESPLRA